jgi:hypothetical protein
VSQELLVLYLRCPLHDVCYLYPLSLLLALSALLHLLHLPHLHQLSRLRQLYCPSHLYPEHLAEQRVAGLQLRKPAPGRHL